MVTALLLLATAASSLTLTSLQGVDAPKLRIGDNALGVRGLLASEPIKKGDQLIAAPRASALETTSLEAKTAPRDLKREGYCDDAGWQQAGWQGRLALRLLRAREDEAELSAWFDALPQSYNELPVVAWTDADLSDCAYAPLQDAVSEQKRTWKRAEDALLPSTSFSQKELRWALATVLTRSFSGPLEATSPTQRLATVGFAGWLAGGYVVGGYGPWETALQGFLAVTLATLLSDYFVAKNDDLNLERHALAPGVDFLNHAGAVEGGAAYEYFGDQFAVRAHDDLRAGDEAFASYGAKSNALLLANYGFVETNNPHDDYVFGAVPLSAVTERPGDADRLRRDRGPGGRVLQRVPGRRAREPGQGVPEPGLRPGKRRGAPCGAVAGAREGPGCARRRHRGERRGGVGSRVRWENHRVGSLASRTTQQEREEKTPARGRGPRGFLRARAGGAALRIEIRVSQALAQRYEAKQCVLQCALAGRDLSGVGFTSTETHSTRVAAKPCRVLFVGLSCGQISTRGNRTAPHAIAARGLRTRSIKQRHGPPQRRELAQGHHRRLARDDRELGPQ